MTYFITRSNFIRITSKVKLTEDDVKQAIYKKKIFFFNQIDEKKILSVKQFLVNAEDGVYEFVEKGFLPDTYSFVNEESRHAKYHTNKSCEGLHATYKDYEIPVEIKYRTGESKVDVKRVEEFRKWFKQEDIQNLFLKDPKKFVERLQIKFNLQNPPKPVEMGGNGVQGIKTLSEKELEAEIDKLISAASEHYRSSTKVNSILVDHGLSKNTYWVTSKKYREMEITCYCIKCKKGLQTTGYSDAEVREVLLEFYNKIKRPIINYLIDYWIIKLNPGLNFDKNILEQLEFKPCNLCIDKNKTENIELDIDDSEYDTLNDDLPF
jgi:hypothetical protein